MPIDSPQTYGEWFFSQAWEKDQFWSEEQEKALSPIAATLIDGMTGYDELPTYIKAFMQPLKKPPSPGLDNAISRFVAQVGSGLAQRVLGHELKDFDML